MMTDEALDLSATLAAELAANDEDMTRDEIEAAQSAPRFVDTRSMPARFSHLKEMGRSAAHCRASFARRDDLDTLAVRLGAGTHAMMFDQPRVMWDNGTRRKGTEKKPSPWDMFRAEHAGKVILNRREWMQATAITNAVKAHPIASRLLFAPGIVHEETITWEQRGRVRRSTPDARGPGHVVELKSTRNAEKRAFSRDAGFRHYHCQLADYGAAIEALTGTRPREYYIVAVESAFPYVVQVYQLTDVVLEQGKHLVNEWLDKLIMAEQTGSWPPYSVAIEPLEIWQPFAGDDDASEDGEAWPDAFSEPEAAGAEVQP